MNEIQYFSDEAFGKAYEATLEYFIYGNVNGSIHFSNGVTTFKFDRVIDLRDCISAVHEVKTDTNMTDIRFITSRKLMVLR